MSTQAAPIAGGGGPSTYQSLFNQTYYGSKNPVFWPLFAGRPDLKGNARWSALPQLSQDDTWTLVGHLIATGWIVDEEIDAEGMEPFTTMFMRELYGQTWEPAGLGKTQSTEVLIPGMFSGPVPSGTIKVSTNLADFPPYVPPPPPAAPPGPGKMANPVGRRLSFGNPATALDDNFGAIESDGYMIGDTWTGSVGQYSGTWTKEVISMGMMLVWQKTA